jgi:hypothetical protein
MGRTEAVALQPHQERVVEEKKDLDTKIDKLKDFIEGPIHSTLPEEEKTRMATQLHHMKEYATVLGHRIAAFV